MLRGGAGERAFELAVSGKCKLFLSQTAVLRFMTRSWRGYAFDTYAPSRVQPASCRSAAVAASSTLLIMKAALTESRKFESRPDRLLNPESLGSADEHALIPILVLRGVPRLFVLLLLLIPNLLVLPLVTAWPPIEATVRAALGQRHVSSGFQPLSCVAGPANHECLRREFESRPDRHDGAYILNDPMLKYTLASCGSHAKGLKPAD